LGGVKVSSESVHPLRGVALKRHVDRWIDRAIGQGNS